MKDMDRMVLAARSQFEDLLTHVQQAAGQETALHEVERSVFRALLALGRTLLGYFLQQKGAGDCGPSVSSGEGSQLLRGPLCARAYRSIFGEVTIERYVYGSGAEQQGNPSWLFAKLK